MSAGSWLVLARNGYVLREAIEQCKREGFLFSIYGKSSVDPERLASIRAWERLRKGEAIDAATTLVMLKQFKDVRQPRGGLKDKPYTLDMLAPLGVKSREIWHEALTNIPLRDRSYLIAALRHGEKLGTEPRIHLSTIHGAKGGQADNVVLLTDVAARTYAHTDLHPDDEHRVLYVAVTRTLNRLFVINPRTEMHLAV